MTPADVVLEVTDLSSGRATRSERIITLERPTP